MISFHQFANRNELDEQFAEQVANLLATAIEKKGKASIAVSGGSTPKNFFKQLSTKDIDWQNVTITLADERWVNETSDASNTALVKANLCQNLAAKATFFELKRAGDLSEQTLAELNEQAKTACLPFDVLILGMGEDGHTASLFPCSDEINQALSEENNVLMKVVPKTAPHQRITFTLLALLKSENIFLHICSEAKRKVYQQAIDGADIKTMPIRAFLHNPLVNVKVLWAE
jgi:6-phosphogluconolactonase